MTNIQAIDLLKGLEQSLDDYCELNDEGKTAFRMAITALEVFGISEQLPSAQPDVLDTNVGDMISRQAAMERLMAQNVIMDGAEYHNGFNAGVNRAQEVIKNLPTVQTEIIHCKDCLYKKICSWKNQGAEFCSFGERGKQDDSD